MSTKLQFSMIAIFLIVLCIFISARFSVLESRINNALTETQNNKIAIEGMQCSINAILSAMTAPYDGQTESGIILDTLQACQVTESEIIKDSISIVLPSGTKQKELIDEPNNKNKPRSNNTN